MVHFTEINQTPPPYSTLQHIGREATPKLGTRNSLKYLQATLIIEGGSWFQNLCELLWKGIKSIISMKNRNSNDSPTSTIHEGNFIANPFSIANVFFSTVPTKILKLLHLQISKHLTDIFNLSFTTSVFPNSLKSVTVIPIHKKTPQNWLCLIIGQYLIFPTRTNY